MIKRIAMWRLNNANDAAEMSDKLLSMESRVPSLQNIEVGINQSTSDAAFDIVFTGCFESWEALEAFNQDPFHKSISAWVSDARKVRHVVDYEI
ncbi:MAG: Dabb family protein [Gammaproteobacteria bacterium]|nr:Dabb family protein [Gammaproteobacteria bacterium]